MLKQAQRIRLESDYKSILRKGRRFYSSYFTMFVKTQNDLGFSTSRFGFIASKKVGKAVVRNRAKRQIREIIRLNMDKIKAGYDIVIIISPKAAGESYLTLETAVITQLKYGKLFK